MKRLAWYLRVSAIGQNEAGQRREIECWLLGNGIDAGCVRWYLDKATGDNLDRPGFAQLQGDIFRGRVGTLASWPFHGVLATLPAPRWDAGACR